MDYNLFQLASEYSTQGETPQDLTNMFTTNGVFTSAAKYAAATNLTSYGYTYLKSLVEDEEVSAEEQKELGLEAKGPTNKAFVDFKLQAKEYETAFSKAVYSANYGSLRNVITGFGGMLAGAFVDPTAIVVSSGVAVGIHRALKGTQLLNMVQQQSFAYRSAFKVGAFGTPEAALNLAHGKLIANTLEQPYKSLEIFADAAFGLVLGAVGSPRINSKHLNRRINLNRTRELREKLTTDETPPPVKEEAKIDLDEEAVKSSKEREETLKLLDELKKADEQMQYVSANKAKVEAEGKARLTKKAKEDIEVDAEIERELELDADASVNEILAGKTLDVNNLTLRNFIETLQANIKKLQLERKSDVFMRDPTIRNYKAITTIDEDFIEFAKDHLGIDNFKGDEASNLLRFLNEMGADAFNEIFKSITGRDIVAEGIAKVKSKKLPTMFDDLTLPDAIKTIHTNIKRLKEEGKSGAPSNTFDEIISQNNAFFKFAYEYFGISKDDLSKVEAVTGEVVLNEHGAELSYFLHTIGKDTFHNIFKFEPVEGGQQIISLADEYLAFNSDVAEVFDMISDEFFKSGDMSFDTFLRLAKTITDSFKIKNINMSTEFKRSFDDFVKALEENTKSIEPRSKHELNPIAEEKPKTTTDIKPELEDKEIVTTKPKLENAKDDIDMVHKAIKGRIDLNLPEHLAVYKDFLSKIKVDNNRLRERFSLYEQTKDELIKKELELDYPFATKTAQRKETKKILKEEFNKFGVDMPVGFDNFVKLIKKEIPFLFDSARNFYDAWLDFRYFEDLDKLSFIQSVMNNYKQNSNIPRGLKTRLEKLRKKGDLTESEKKLFYNYILYRMTGVNNGLKV